MDMPVNRFKAALKAGQPQIGLWTSLNDSAAVELLAGCGYDWITLDAEHGALDPLRILPLLQAMAPYPVSPVVRPSCLNVAEIKKLLDLGAQTLVIPQIQSVEEAQLAVDACAYPPIGIRGMAGVTRASRFGTIQGYATRAREEICLILQVETKQALDRLEAIAGVPGVDGVFIGPADLAASLGFPGQPSHPTVKAACLDAMARLKAMGVPSGFLTLDAEVTKEIMAAGCVFTAVDVDMNILRSGAVAQAERWKAIAQTL